MSINYLCRAVTITLRAFWLKETLTRPCYGGNIDHFSARRFCNVHANRAERFSGPRKKKKEKKKRRTRSRVNKWGGLLDHLGWSGFILKPTNTTFYWLSCARQSDLKYRSTISFMVTFYGNNRYGAERRFFGRGASSVVFCTLQFSWAGRANMLQSSFNPTAHMWRWILLIFFPPPVSIIGNGTYEGGKSVQRWRSRFSTLLYCCRSS